jgi:acetyl-CoA acetyltransferase
MWRSTRFNLIRQAIGRAILAEIVSHAIVGLEPDAMGVGPVTAIPAALEEAGIALADIDLIEVNEALPQHLLL